MYTGVSIETRILYMSEKYSIRMLWVFFRLSLKEFKEAQRIASLVSNAGKIPSDRVATLAKACHFVGINEWILIEVMEKAIEERDEALKGSTRTIPPAGYG